MAIRFAHPEVSETDATRYASALQVEAQEHDFDPLTGIAIIHHESRFHPRAVSPDGEDYGLAQVRARHVGACRKDRHPRRNPSAACRAVKQRLLEPEESIRIMAELITSHRKLCAKKAGNTSMLSWLASYQGRNSIKEDRWCMPGDGTHQVIRYRERLVRELARHERELETVEVTAAAERGEPGDQVADSRGEPAPARAATAGPRGG